MSLDESPVLQSRMVVDWGRVLVRRGVAKLGLEQSSRRRSSRRTGYLRIRNLLLASGESAVLPSSGSDPEEDTTCVGRVRKFSRPADSDESDGGSSEDEPLARRVRPRAAGMVSEDVSLPDGELLSEGASDEEGDDFEEVPCEEVSDEGSESGYPGSFGEEEGASSEEESADSDYESEDDVIYVGTQSAPTALLRQSLVSSYFVRK
jgi:hypothetical protein